jgi:hypothetical protein
MAYNRDKASLDIFWLRAANLEAALEQFYEIASDLDAEVA